MGSGGYVPQDDAPGTIKNYGFIKFKPEALPALDASYVVTEATLHGTAAGANQAIYASEVGADYYPGTLTYANSPALAYNEFTDGYRLPATAGASAFTLDITRLVWKWYEGKNYGVALETRRTSRGRGAVTVYATANSGPYLKITYVSRAGLEDHIRYDSFSIGRAGTAHVNLFNGNLVFSHTDTVSGGSRLPISITHYYNSCNASNDNYNASPGWRHTLQETLHLERLQATTGSALTNIYVHTRADGSRAYYQRSGSTGKDLSGTMMKMTFQTVTEGGVSRKIVKLTDKQDNEMVFAEPTVPSNGRDMNFTLLETLKDAMGNTIQVNRAGSGAKILSAVDGAGRTTAFQYSL